MDAQYLENIKKAEEALKRLQDGEPKSDAEFGLGEASKLPQDSPLIGKIREDRMRWEVAQREMEQAAKQMQIAKIRKAKRLNQLDVQRTKEANERKAKVGIDLVEKVNSDLKDAQQIVGKVCQLIDSNESYLRDQPHLKVKMQRIKRMMTAFYYGLKQASINPKKGDFLNDKVPGWK